MNTKRRKLMKALFAGSLISIFPVTLVAEVTKTEFWQSNRLMFHNNGLSYLYQPEGEERILVYVLTTAWDISTSVLSHTIYFPKNQCSKTH